MTRTASYVTELGPTDRIRVGELPLPPLGRRRRDRPDRDRDGGG
jgi:hypothetical protein